MSSYSDDDYLRLLAKYNDANKRLKAAEARAVDAEWECEQIARDMPVQFLLDLPDGGDVKLQEGVQRLVARWWEAERQLAAAREALERIEREAREEMGACQDVFDLGETARAALANLKLHNATDPAP